MKKLLPKAEGILRFVKENPLKSIALLFVLAVAVASFAFLPIGTRQADKTIEENIDPPNKDEFFVPEGAIIETDFVAHDFGVITGERTKEKVLLVSNSGEKILTISSLETTAGLVIEQESCTANNLLPGDAGCSITLQFGSNLPKGIQSAELTIVGSATNSPVKIPFSGEIEETRLPAKPNFSVQRIDFQQVETGVVKKQFVTFANSGGTTLEVKSILMSPNIPSLSLDASKCLETKMFAPGDNCSFVLVWSPDKELVLDAQIDFVFASLKPVRLKVVGIAQIYNFGDPKKGESATRMSAQEQLFLRGLESLREQSNLTLLNRSSRDPLTVQQDTDYKSIGLDKERVFSPPVDRSRLITQDQTAELVLRNRFNSAVAGAVQAVSSRNLYSADNRNVLVPAGSVFIGESLPFDSQGATRAIVVWKRVIKPNGQSVLLSDPLADIAGAIGLPGKINRRYKQRFGLASLLSLLNATGIYGITYLSSSLSPPATDGSAGALARQQAQQQALGASVDALSNPLNSIVNQVLRENANIPPIMTAEPGTIIRVSFTADLYIPIAKLTRNVKAVPILGGNISMP